MTTVIISICILYAVSCIALAWALCASAAAGDRAMRRAMRDAKISNPFVGPEPPPSPGASRASLHNLKSMPANETTECDVRTHHKLPLLRLNPNLFI